MVHPAWDAKRGHPLDYARAVRPDERAVLERGIQRVTEQAASADAIVDEAMAAGRDGSDKIVLSTKMLRPELLSVKADLERELEKVVLDCAVCGRTVHYVGALGVRASPGRTRNPHRTRRSSSRGTALKVTRPKDRRHMRRRRWTAKSWKRRLAVDVSGDLLVASSIASGSSSRTSSVWSLRSNAANGG